MSLSRLCPGLGGGVATSATSGGAPPGDAYTNQYSIMLDGTDDYMSSGFAPKTIGTGDYSLSFWFRMSALADDLHPYFVVFGADASTGSTYQGVGLTQKDGTGYKVRINNSFSAYNAEVSSSTSDVVPGQWYHFVLTRDGQVLTLYRNGSSFLILDMPDVGSNTLALGDDLRIGYGYGPASTRFVYGNMDEFAVFGSALSASDVTAIYNSGNPASLDAYSPLGWWRMGDNNGGAGTTVTDQGSGGNNGTLVNGPTYSTDVPS